MKKIQILNSCNIVILLALVCVIVFQATSKYYNEIDYYIYSIMLSVVVSLLSKAIIFKNDSSAWFGLVLLGVVIIQFLYSINLFNVKKYWVIYFELVGLCNIIVSVFNRGLLLCLFGLLLIIVGVIIYLNIVGYISIVAMFILVGLIVLLHYLITKIIKRKEYGKV